MDNSLLLRGLVIGFSIAAPVGPIGLLCIRRTLAEGRAFGLASGLGAATADALYGCVAGFGLTAVSSLLVSQQAWLRLIGGAFLCYLGLRTLLSPPAAAPAITPGAAAKGLLGAYTSTLVLTLTNPLSIFAFAAIFAGLGGATNIGDGSAVLLVLGVFLGSAGWWLVLSGGVSLLRSRVTLAILRWVNRLSGVVIVGFGLAALLGGR